MALLLQHKYRSPRKFYKKHLQDLKYNANTNEELSLLNEFVLVDFEVRNTSFPQESTVHQLPYIGKVEE